MLFKYIERINLYIYVPNLVCKIKSTRLFVFLYFMYDLRPHRSFDHSLSLLCLIVVDLLSSFLLHERLLLSLRFLIVDYF
jgi:hypothetical protein